ncbi:MAG: thioredoxin domain-containing protein [Flavobacteriaceae bacterium]
MRKKRILYLIVLVFLSACAQKKEKMDHKYTNALIHETSPYLLQHAHNPVNWEAWRPEVLQRAKEENKLLLISIGYAACHWCHVMEEECFEDEQVAQMMNSNFINIKIDREERPDVDQIYMDALQMLTGNGGWPLNIVALPDGRPFWGATYLPKDSWSKSLTRLIELYQKDPEKIIEYASDLEKGIHAINLVENNTGAAGFSMEELRAAVNHWSSYFDSDMGGYNRAPKFMMPNNLDFLLHYGTSQNDKKILEHVENTLTKMAYGGIHDHVGGGFARYSVDAKWHVPHFEKMLYDNGQLVSLYAQAHAVTKNPLYEKVARRTIAFVLEELTHEDGGFYSSLDADSLHENGELEEGAFYVWTKEELQRLLGDDFEIFGDYFNVNGYGLWEEGNYVLIRDGSHSGIAKKHSISEDTLEKKMDQLLALLKKEREKRPKPRLDDKILTSWNGLMLKGLVDAHRYLGDRDYLMLALKNAEFIKREMIKKDGGLYRNHKEGKSTINGFLEDYAIVIEAFLALYEVTFDDQWLYQAKELLNYTMEHFRNTENGMCYFTSDQDNSLIRRTIEINDNVISASNSIMAKNLLKFHKLFPDDGYGAMAHQMLGNVHGNFNENAQSFANWLHLVLYENLDFYEVAILGEDYKKMGREIASHYLPNSILVGSPADGTIELLKNRFSENETLVYVCIEGACKLPVTSAKEAIDRL